MATTTQIPNLQSALADIEALSVAGAAPFIKSDAGQATEKKVVAEVNLGIAALPLIGNLLQSLAPFIHNLGSIFHHAHAAANQPAPAQPATNPVAVNPTS